MPTVPSWTEGRRAVEDLRALLAFRFAGVRGRSRRRLLMALVLVGLVTFAVIVGAARTSTAYLTGEIPAFQYLPTPDQMREALPSAYAAFLLLAAGTAVATGGGRELLARDRAVAYPIGPATDHLGSLLLAPLSLAWLVQAWGLLGAVGYAGGWRAALAGTPLVLVWLAFGTAFGQVVGWWMEVLRRRPRGVLLSRGLTALLGAIAAVLFATGRMGDLAAMLPTSYVSDAAVAPGLAWFAVLALELVLLVLAVLAGFLPSELASRLAPREEQRMETGRHTARRVTVGPDSWPGDLHLLVKVDRASVWRSVPLRRGSLVLAVLPGLAGLASAMPWHIVVILPGLVASGIALLFGVNAWAIDGRGMLWRESLPVRPSLVYAARSIVLVELMAFASLATLVLVGLRAGLPSAPEASALVCAWLVATAQVAGAAATWSVRSPYAVDLRSARATPAPPVVMVGYSAKLALVTTLTGMLFSGLAQISAWQPALAVAVVFLAWSAVRLLRARSRWSDPSVRSMVVTTVAA